jgi:hypothetical protein
MRSALLAASPPADDAVSRTRELMDRLFADERERNATMIVRARAGLLDRGRSA